MNDKIKLSKEEEVCAANQTILEDNCLKALKIVLLTSSKPKKFIVALKPLSRLNAKSQKSEKSETQGKKNSKRSGLIDFNGKYLVDTKLFPILSIFGKDKNIADKDLPCLEVKKYGQRQRVPDIIRLTGGWGLGKSETKKKSDGNKHKFETPDDKRSSNFERENETIGKESADESVFKSQADSLEASEKLNNLQVELKDDFSTATKVDLSEKVKTDKFSFVANSVYTQTPTFEDKYQLNCNNKSSIPAQMEHSSTQTEIVTSSFIHDLIDETCSFPSEKSDINHLIPICTNTDPFHPQYDQTKPQLLSDFFCITPTDEEISKRIDVLEEQMSVINCEVKHLQEMLVPSEDLVKFKLLSKHFEEVDSLLSELGQSFLKFQRFDAPMEQKEGNKEREIVQDNSPIDANFGSQVSWETCNCKIFKKSDSAFPTTRREENEPYQNCSCKCNCIKYSQNFQENYFNIASSKQDNIKTNSVPNKSKQSNQANYQKNHISQSLLNETSPKLSSTSIWHDEVSSQNKNISRHSAGRNASIEVDITNPSPKETISSTCDELPLTAENLSKAIRDIIGNVKANKVALTVYQEPNDLYLISVSLLRTGQCLGLIHTNKMVFMQARKEKLFNKFLIFFVLNSKNTFEDSSPMINHSFEFLNTGNQKSN